jgi:hypothetical protein
MTAVPAGLRSVPGAVFDMVLWQAHTQWLAADITGAGQLLQWLSLLRLDDGCNNGIISLVPQLLYQMSVGLDYYGYPTQFAPITSLSTGYQFATSTLEYGDAVEQSYLQYFSASSSVDQRLQQLRIAASGMETGAKLLQQQLSELRSRIAGHQQQLQDLIVQRSVLANRLEAATTGFKTAIERQIQRQAAWAGFTTFLDVLRTIGEVAVSSIDSVSTIINAAGKGRHLFGSVEGVVSFASAVQQPANLDSFRSLSNLTTDPDGAKLLMDNNAADEWLQPYLGLPEAQPYLQAMQSYWQACVAVSDAALVYTASYAKHAQLREQLAAKASELQAVQDALAAGNHPELAQLTNWMSGLYQEVKGSILQVAYEIYLATQYAFLPSAPSGFDCAADTIATLKGCVLGLLKDAYDGLQSRGGTYQCVEDISVRFDVQPTLTADDLTWSIQLPLFHPAFDKMSSMIVQYYCSIGVYLQGVKLRPGFDQTRLRLVAKHSGSSRFSNPDGHVLNFVHRQCTVVFEYDVRSNATTIAGWLGGGSEGALVLCSATGVPLGGGDPYIGLSPFTFNDCGCSK